MKYKSKNYGFKFKNSLIAIIGDREVGWEGTSPPPKKKIFLLLQFFFLGGGACPLPKKFLPDA